MRTGDVTSDELEEIEADIAWWMREQKLDDDDVPNMEDAVYRLTGRHVELAPLGKRTEGRCLPVGRTQQIQTRWDLLGTPRGRQTLGHEFCHAFYRIYQKREVSEAYADAFGVALAAPRRAVQLAMREFSRRSPALLAETLLIEPAAALLRLGEVSSCPVVLERRKGVLLHRGPVFEWPPRIAWFGVDRRLAHPVRAGVRWGLIAA